jgi:hypothetical protein
VFLAVSAVAALAQETQSTTVKSIPAASRSQADCTGFFGAPHLSDDFVVGGGDDDFHSVVRAFVTGESVYLAKRGGGTPDFAVGSVYSIVRKAKDIFLTRRYSGQGGALREMGAPYEDAGRVRVTHVNATGAVAKVEFSCAPIIPGDLVIPYERRTIPEYTVTAPLDTFMPLNEGKKHGMITAAINNYGYFATGAIVYLNLGESDGAQPGQRFRVYKVLPPKHLTWGEGNPVPPETIGEAVVLSVQPRSCVAILVQTYREVYAGDRVEAE